MDYTGTAYSEEWAREAARCMGMVRGAWFSSHQEPGSLISGRGWRCPTVVCGWSPVTLGPAFELVTLKGGFQTLTGESVTELVMVSLELERAHGARRGGIRAQRRATSPQRRAFQSALRTAYARAGHSSILLRK